MNTTAPKEAVGRQEGLEHKLIDPAGFIKCFPQLLDLLAVRLDDEARKAMLEVEDGLRGLRKAGYYWMAGIMEDQYHGVLFAELERENPKYTIH